MTNEFGALLSDVRFRGGTPIIDGVLHEVQVPGRLPLRLYVMDEQFVLVEWASSSENYDGDDAWADPGLRVEVVLRGVSYYREDGVRHLDVGEGGYLHYPSALGLSRAFALIHDLFEEQTP